MLHYKIAERQAFRVNFAVHNFLTQCGKFLWHIYIKISIGEVFTYGMFMGTTCNQWWGRQEFPTGAA